MGKCKILIVAGAMDVGGIENQLMHLLRRCDRDRFQIDFTTTMSDPHYGREILALGGKLHRIPGTHSGLLRYCRALYRVMAEGNYDIVHSHELFHSGIVLLLAKLAGIPHRFVHAHNWDDGDGSGRKRPLHRSLYNAVMRWAIGRFSTCPIACSTLAGRFLYGEKDFHLLFNSVDTGKFLDHYDDRETGEFCDDGFQNVLHVGRITAVKNQLFLVEVARELRRRGKNIRILCAGSGDEDYQARVEEAIREKGLEQHIQLLGLRRDIDVLMRKSAAFVLPSKYEGMPLVLIEAQASGLPCVSADTFSREVDFGIGTIRWLPPEADAARWADAIEAAVSTGRAEKAAVQGAVEEKGFDSDSFARKLCELYQNALEGSKA